MRLRLAALLIAAVSPTAGAAASSFRPEAFFAGRTRSEGAFVDGQGRPESRFVGDTRGRRAPDGSTIFHQVIRFDDGTRRVRDWRIVRRGDEVEATASDVVGVARGRIVGRELRLDYTVRTAAGNPLLDVDFEQHLVLERGGRSVANRSIIRKFGIVIREARERFLKVSGASRRRD